MSVKRESVCMICNTFSRPLLATFYCITKITHVGSNPVATGNPIYHVLETDCTVKCGV